MEQEKKNQYLLVSVVVILLIAVFVIGINFVVKQRNKLLKEQGYLFKQVYYGEYTLDMIDQNYYVGYLNDKQVNAIINKDGKEIFDNGNDIYYDGIYKTEEGNYLIYSNRDQKLVAYLFDGEKLEKVMNYENVSYAKPIIYTNGNIQYIVGFSSNFSKNLYLYMLKDNNTITIENASLVGDDATEGVYYTYNNNYLVLVNKDQLYGVIDFAGNKVIDYKYKEMISTFNKSFIVKNKKNQYGVIDSSGNELLKLKYKAIACYGNYYLVVNNDNEMAVFDSEFNNLTGFEMKYDSLVDYELRSKMNSMHLWVVGNNIVVVNNYLQDYNKTGYSHSTAYFIKNNKIFKTIKEVGFGKDGVVYSYDKNHVITIYDSDLNEKYTIKLESVNKILEIKKINSVMISVKYLNSDEEEITKYYQDGKEVEYNYGKVLYFNDEYNIYKTENSVDLYNKEMKKIDSVEGDKAQYMAEYLVIGKGIYKIEKRN